MAIPIIVLIISKGKIEAKKANRVALWNSIIIGLILAILTINNGDVWTGGAAVIYYFINKALLTKKAKKTEFMKSDVVTVTPENDCEIKQIEQEEVISDKVELQPKKELNSYDVICETLGIDDVQKVHRQFDTLVQSIKEKTNANKLTELMTNGFNEIYEIRIKQNAKMEKLNLLYVSQCQMFFDAILRFRENSSDFMFAYAMYQMSGIIDETNSMLVSMLLNIQIVLDENIELFYKYGKNDVADCTLVHEKICKELEKYNAQEYEWNNLKKNN